MYWPKTYQAIEKFVTACKECQINKKLHSSTLRLLQPLQIPTRCWDIATCDFLTELSKNQGLDAILVIVDKISKRALVEPLKTPCSAEDVFQISNDRLLAKHGVQAKIISNRDPKFVSIHWTGIAEILNIKLNLSTTDHPQTDSQSENLIRTLLSMLHHSNKRAPNEWDKNP